MTDNQMTTRAATLPAEVPPLADLYVPEHRIDLAKFDEPARKRIAEIVTRYPRLDGAAVNSYGADVQVKANRFLDDLLEGVRTSDVGSSGDLVAEMASGVKMLNIPGMKREAESGGSLIARLVPALASLPVVGKRVSAFQRFKARHAEIMSHFTKLEGDGRREMARLTAWDNKLDKVVDDNLESMRELELHVAAGQAILDREKAAFSAQREEAVAKRDPALIAAVRDRGEQINGYESRLLRLHMAMNDALLSVPQTRLTQSAGRIEYRNVLDTLLFDMPALKRAVVRVAALNQIAIASKNSEARRKLSSAMTEAGVDALDRAYTRAKESEGGALAEIAAMGAIADRIIGMVDKGAEIDARNRTTRDEAARRLVEVREKFVDGLERSTARAVETGRR